MCDHCVSLNVRGLCLPVQGKKPAFATFQVTVCALPSPCGMLCPFGPSGFFLLLETFPGFPHCSLLSLLSFVGPWVPGFCQALFLSSPGYCLLGEARGGSSGWF